jgi:hypothetical protein
MMIIELPVAPYAPPERIREWIEELESMREDPDAEPSDLRQIQRYITMARGWLEDARVHEVPESAKPCAAGTPPNMRHRDGSAMARERNVIRASERGNTV